MQTVTAENYFARSWNLLTRNWVIVVPGLVIGIVTGILYALLAPKTVFTSDTGVTVVTSFGFVQSMLIAIVGILAAIVTISYTTGMAGAAWQRGTTTVADGAAAFAQDAGHVLSAMLALIAVGIVAAILAPFTLGLSILALFFLFPYTMAAAVLGQFGGFDALTESYRIATRHFSTTAIIIIVAFAISIVAGIVGGLLHLVFLIGPIVQYILQEVVLAYLTLVIVGVYLGYRNVAAAAPAAAAPAPAAAAAATPSVEPAPVEPPPIVPDTPSSP
jgi:hypothetical protein